MSAEEKCDIDRPDPVVVAPIDLTPSIRACYICSNGVNMNRNRTT